MDFSLTIGSDQRVGPIGILTRHFGPPFGRGQGPSHNFEAAGCWCSLLAIPPRNETSFNNFPNFFSPCKGAGLPYLARCEESNLCYHSHRLLSSSNLQMEVKTEGEFFLLLLRLSTAESGSSVHLDCPASEPFFLGSSFLALFLPSWSLVQT